MAIDFLFKIVLTDLPELLVVNESATFLSRQQVVFIISMFV